MSNTPLPEPDGSVWVGGWVQQGWIGKSMHAHAAAVSAAKDAEIAGLREDAERYHEWKRAFREGECALWNALCECQSDAEHDAAIDAALAARKGEAC